MVSRNLDRANRLGKAIYSGMTVVNDFAVNYMVQALPFGGVKVSGFDRFAGPEGLRALCLQKSFVTDLYVHGLLRQRPERRGGVRSGVVLSLTPALRQGTLLLPRFRCTGFVSFRISLLGVCTHSMCLHLVPLLDCGAAFLVFAPLSPA